MRDLRVEADLGRYQLERHALLTQKLAVEAQVLEAGRRYAKQHGLVEPIRRGDGDMLGVATGFALARDPVAHGAAKAIVRAHGARFGLGVTGLRVGLDPVVAEAQRAGSDALLVALGVVGFVVARVGAEDDHLDGLRRLVRARIVDDSFLAVGHDGEPLAFGADAGWAAEADAQGVVGTDVDLCHAGGDVGRQALLIERDDVGCAHGVLPG